MTAIIIMASIALLLTSHYISYRMDAKKFKKKAKEKQMYYQLYGKRMKHSKI
jgi:uncharacterized membrane protein SpoIIM required for sporulation